MSSFVLLSYAILVPAGRYLSGIGNEFLIIKNVYHNVFILFLKATIPSQF